MWVFKEKLCVLAKPISPANFNILGKTSERIVKTIDEQKTTNTFFYLIQQKTKHSTEKIYVNNSEHKVSRYPDR